MKTAWAMVSRAVQFRFTLTFNTTPAPQQVHQHSHDEPTEEPPPDTSTQTLVNKCLAESGIDPTDTQNVMPVSCAKKEHFTP